jgi:hypothetical protein
MTQKQMPSHREQYGGTVHLFIGAGHSPCKITPMPFTFGNNSIVIHQGLNSLFIFKLVSFSAITPKLSCSHLRRCVNLRILWASPTVVLIRVRRYLFTHYTPETSLNHVFEDLRKPKAPNMKISQLWFLVNSVVSTTPILKPFSRRKSRRHSYQALGACFNTYSTLDNLLTWLGYLGSSNPGGGVAQHIQVH